MIGFPGFYEGGCVDAELLLKDLFTVSANKAADGLTGISVVPWWPKAEVVESTLAAGNGFLRIQRTGGVIDINSQRWVDVTRNSITAMTPSRELSWRLIEYVRQIMYAFHDGGLVHRAAPINGYSTTFMKVPGEVVGPQLVSEQLRDERVVPAWFEVHTDRPGGLPEYRESLGLDD